MAKTKLWDAVEHLETEEDTAVYLEAALEDGDPALIAAAFSELSSLTSASERRGIHAAEPGARQTSRNAKSG